MLTLLKEKLPELERLCKLHGVKRLEVVGSAAREVDFDPARSDVDFLVEFEPGRPNANKFRHLRRVNGLLGLYVPVLATPLELLGETDESPI